MKKTPSLLTKSFVFFLIAQFLNVQIQSSFATEAVTSHNPYVQQMMKKLEDRITLKMGEKSEYALNRIAYRLYKMDLKLRNKAVKKEAGEADLLSKEDHETMSLFQDGASPELAQEFNKLDRKQVKKEKILADTDSLLIALGSELQLDGSLSKATFNEFKEKVSQLEASQLRAPASVGKIILKVILSLLIAASGLALFYFSVVIIALSVWGGTILAANAQILIILLAAGLLTGVIFGITAVWTSALRANQHSPLIAA